MKFGVTLLTTASCAQAAWLRWSVNRDAVWAAQETSGAKTEQPVGWSPMPTPAPGLRTPEEEVIELLRRGSDSGSSSSTDWENSNTCGWFSGISSSPVACGNGFTCTTNSQHVVACASGTLQPFYTECLDYNAVQAGSCLSVGSATGCCQDASEPACGTYIWTGSPERFMYKCFATASVLSILDVPQFVIDASIFSKTHTTPTPTITSSDSTATSGQSVGQSGGTSGPGSTSSGTGTGSSGSSSGTPGSSSSKTTSTSTPVIVGSAVGSILGLLLLLLILWCCLKRKAKGKLGLGFSSKKKNKTQNKSESTETYNINQLPAGKERTSSVSDATITRGGVAVPVQEHHYHHQEYHNYNPQAAAQERQLESRHEVAGNPQPSVVSSSFNHNHTSQSPSRYPGSILHSIKNDNSTIQHSRQPSISERSATNGAPSVSGSTFQPHFLAGGMASRSVPQNQQQPQYQNVPPQLQPVNHIHVYYAPPMHHEAASSRSPPSDSNLVVHNHIHQTPGEQVQNQSSNSIYDYYDRNQSRSRTRDASQQSRGRRRYAEGERMGSGEHSRDVSAVSSVARGGRSPSPEVMDPDWKGATGGPGFRQSM
ncbi:hypothetical protein F5Y16DRAFT_184973 [Xylariaceae sp. FL0255]|nr:hypothetical protein F5Y16DRAFT_184973 [Xylariaceae sp. FL0255]